MFPTHSVICIPDNVLVVAHDVNEAVDDVLPNALRTDNRRMHSGKQVEGNIELVTKRGLQYTVRYLE